MKYDIFISYRREGGYDTAKHLNDLLVRDGYKVSFDIDTLRNGDFDVQLLERIEQCKDFILIVDQHAFDRTLNPTFDRKKDWLRCELAHALKHNKNIIPIFLSGVKGFPEGLPDDIANVEKKNAPEYSHYYFDAFYERLKTDFILSKSNCIIEKRNEKRITDLYSVGSVYSKSGKQGVVVEVDESGLHGKIMSFEQSFQLWTSDDFEAKRYIGLSDQYDGFNNMLEIKKISNWKYKFPAFDWCSQLGPDWYLPAIHELELVLLNEKKLNKVNDCLKEVNAPQLFSKIRFWQLSKYYGSSTEDVTSKISTLIDGACVRCVPTNDWFKMIKKSGCVVRAFAKF